MESSTEDAAKMQMRRRLQSAILQMSCPSSHHQSQSWHITTGVMQVAEDFGLCQHHQDQTHGDW